MTEFKVGDEVIYGFNGERSTLTRKIPYPEMFNGMWNAIGPDGNDRIYKESEIKLAKPQKETEVTEFKKGDTIRVLRNRNAYGEELGWRAKELNGEYIIQEESDVNCYGDHGSWVGYVLKGTNYWVRSDDIELVSRAPEKIISNDGGFTIDFANNKIEIPTHIEDINQILEPDLFGTIEFGPYRKIKINPIINDYEDPYVNLKIKKSNWDAEELAALVIHLSQVVDYLEGKETGECVFCENDTLKEKLNKIREIVNE